MLKDKKSCRLFLIVFVGMVLAGVGLILLAPSLAGSGGILPWIGFAALGLTLIGCMFIARHVRPDRVGPR